MRDPTSDDCTINIDPSPSFGAIGAWQTIDYGYRERGQGRWLRIGQRRTKSLRR
jgi:hypothetical protein